MYSTSVIIGVSAIFASQIHAIEFLAPRATSVAADKYDLVGFSPKPTSAPSPLELKARAYNLFHPRAVTTNTCGYFNADENDPYTCGANSACLWNTKYDYFGCCSVDGNGGFFLSSCQAIANPYTSCYPYSGAAGCIGSCYTENRVCDSSLPFCGVGYLMEGATTFTQYFCNSIEEAATLFLSNTFTTPNSSPAGGGGTTPGPAASSSSASSASGAAVGNISVGGNSVVTVTQTAGSSSSTSDSGSSASSGVSALIGTGGGDGSKSKSHAGAIAGGVVGGLAALGVIVGGTILALHQRKLKQRQLAHMEVSQIGN